MRPTLGLAAIAVCLVSSFPAYAETRETEYTRQRAKMVRTVESIAAFSTGAPIAPRIDASVLNAMRQVPRHAFVPESQRAFAYEDRSLPIGYGQTISQPYIVALMTDLLDVEAGDSVLEVGTGSGYQAAVLAALGAKVTTIEIVPELSDWAAEVLAASGYEDVHVVQGDGYRGWPDGAPYEGIIVTAAPDHVPPALLKQLRPGGRMVIPVGPVNRIQQLTLITKNKKGKIRSRKRIPVRFVPLTGAGEE